MADPRFFKKVGNFKIGYLAEALGCALSDGADADRLIEDVAPLKAAKSSDLSFLDNIKYKADFGNTKAGACIVNSELAHLAPTETVCLISKTPYKTYARAAQLFYPEPKPSPMVSAQAIIDKTATIGAGCVIEHGVIIGAGVRIGAGTWLEAGCIIRDNVEIGENCRIGVSATISHAILGNNVRLYTGVRVGQDGFGFAIDPKGHVKVPQLGKVIIGDHVEIGANTTIDRGSGPDTVIGAGTWIDNLVQIGHNVAIGRGCILVSQCGISGSTILGDFVAIGGQAGIAGHLMIGTGARIAGKSGVMRDVPAGEEYMGYPAFPMKQYLRQVAALNSLIKRKKND